MALEVAEVFHVVRDRAGFESACDKFALNRRRTTAEHHYHH